MAGVTQAEAGGGGRAVFLLGVGGQEEHACLPPGGQFERWRQGGLLGGCLGLPGKKQWWLGLR